MNSGTLKRLPIPLWGALLSSLCMIVGWQWDICWHRSVGRDTIWTPPHVSIYIALAIAFLYNSQIVLSRTFGRSDDDATVSVLGFRGPIAAFVALAGVFLQFSAIVWDNWWHGVYGLDPTVFSPPHMLIANGINLFYLGQFLLVVRYRNSCPEPMEPVARWIILILWAMFLGHCAIGPEDAFGPMRVRAHAFVHTSALVFPFVLVIIYAYIPRRWSSVASALLYMAGTIVLMQVLQSFPATPRFGPVFHRVASFLPPSFPLLLFVPALTIHPILSRLGPTLRPVTLLLLGTAFVATFTPVNWLFSWFLTTPWAANRFFAGNYPGTVFEATYRQSASLGPDLASVGSLLLALVIASVSSGAGLIVGRWLRGVVR